MMSFSISTISAGSMKTVLPVEDVSYTSPGIFFLFDALTGMSSFPSLTERLASESIMPSAWACFNIAFARFEMADSFDFKDLRICRRLSDAVSFTSPNLSRMVSILRCTSGKHMTFWLICFRFG